MIHSSATNDAWGRKLEKITRSVLR